MPDVEFVAEDADAPATSRVRRARLVLVLAAAALLVAVVVIVGRNGEGAPPRSVPSAVASSTHGPGPAPTLALPPTLAFGPKAVDVLAVDDRVFALSPTVVGVGFPANATYTVRPAPNGLGSGRPTLLLDEPAGVLWTVAVGGTAFGAYRPQHLDSLADGLSQYRIEAAAAAGGALWLATEHGLYRFRVGARIPGRVSAVVFTALAAGAAGQLYGLAGRRLYEFDADGSTDSNPLPILHPDGLAVVGHALWVSGHDDTSAALFPVDPNSLAVAEAPIAGSAAAALRILGSYGSRILVSGFAPGALTCIDTAQRKAVQTWAYRTGAVSLDGNGLYLARGQGIELLNARGCLAG